MVLLGVAWGIAIRLVIWAVIFVVGGLLVVDGFGVPVGLWVAVVAVGAIVHIVVGIAGGFAELERQAASERRMARALSRAMHPPELRRSASAADLATLDFDEIERRAVLEGDPDADAELTRRLLEGESDEFER